MQVRDVVPSHLCPPSMHSYTPFSSLMRLVAHAISGHAQSGIHELILLLKRLEMHGSIPRFWTGFRVE